MTLKERAIIAKEMLGKQKGITYEEALIKQAIRKSKSITTIKKGIRYN